MDEKRTNFAAAFTSPYCVRLRTEYSFSRAFHVHRALSTDPILENQNHNHNHKVTKNRYDSECDPEPSVFQDKILCSYCHSTTQQPHRPPQGKRRFAPMLQNLSALSSRMSAIHNHVWGRYSLIPAKKKTASVPDSFLSTSSLPLIYPFAFTKAFHAPTQQTHLLAAGQHSLMTCHVFNVWGTVPPLLFSL